MAGNTIVGVVAAAALVGGGVGAGVVALSHDGGAQTASSTTTTVVTGGSTTNVSNGELTIGEVAQQDSKSVVEIDATQTGSSNFGSGSNSASAEGTGFVYDANGDIVTNDHVIDGAGSITVKFQDGSSYKATVVGKDPSTDIAVLHVDASSSELAPLTLANSDNVQVGDGVVAIGNPFGLDDTVTSGIVSALGRTITAPDGSSRISGAIQTDAAINHGNSGGPLLNMKGEVIGITSQIQSDGGGNEGVGFAIPSNLVKTIAGELISSGSAQHALLGIVPTDSASGVKVTSVEASSGAKKAGLKAGDVITELNGTKIENAAQLRTIISAAKPGDVVTLTVTRDGSTKTVKATLGSRAANS
jgi:putative serine protease PepD